METGKTRKDGKAVDSGNATFVTVAAPDLSRYRAHVAHLGLPSDRENEVMATVYRICQNFVDRAFGDDPVQVARSLKDHSAIKDAGIGSSVLSSAPTTKPKSTGRLTDAFRPIAAERQREEET